jgi:hypothetical protein
MTKAPNGGAPQHLAEGTCAVAQLRPSVLHGEGTSQLRNQKEYPPNELPGGSGFESRCRMGRDLRGCLPPVIGGVPRLGEAKGQNAEANAPPSSAPVSPEFASVLHEKDSRASGAEVWRQ